MGPLLKRSNLFKVSFSLLLTFSFFASYVAPEFIHGAAHAFNRTTHPIAESHSSSIPTVEAATTDTCPFSGLLIAHTNHVFATPSTDVPQVFVSEPSFPVFDSKVPRALARLREEARGPPLNAAA